MKDIDKLLASSDSYKPRRPLRSDFTNQVISHIKAHPRHAGLLARTKEKLTMKLHKKPATAFVGAAFAAVALTGTVFAVAHWPAVTSVFRGETKLPSGNRIVAVDTENCRYDDPNPKDPKSSVYYEIKKDSLLTNEQITDMVLGTCEMDRAYKAVNALIESSTKEYESKNAMSGGPYVVAGIKDGNITFKLAPKLDPKLRFGNDLTYKLSKDIKAYDGAKSINLDNIKVGDTVMLIVADRHAVASEGDINDSNHWDDVTMIPLLDIVRVPELTGTPDTFYAHLGKDFVRMEPCGTDPSGFCRVYPFDEDVDKDLQKNL